MCYYVPKPNKLDVILLGVLAGVKIGIDILLHYGLSGNIAIFAGFAIFFIISLRHRSRFKRLVCFSGDFEKMSACIHDFLLTEDYRVQDYGNETVYRYKGSWMLGRNRCIKFSRAPDGILVEAFLISMGGAEFGLDGFFSGALVAQMYLKDTVEAVIAMIEAKEKR